MDMLVRSYYHCRRKRIRAFTCTKVGSGTAVVTVATSFVYIIVSVIGKIPSCYCVSVLNTVQRCDMLLN